jgi:hypothetical protein
MNLLETYAKRLKVSESVYKKENGDRNLTENQKITIARVLKNTSDYLNEAFSHSVGTQRADMGTYKKFCLDLTTVALPNLIANELVIVKPMTAMTGYIQYLEFVAGSNKGGVEQGDLFANPFKLGEMDNARINYTGAKVVEVAAGAEFIPAWGPVVKAEDGKQYVEEEIAGVWTKKELVGGKVAVTAGHRVRYEYDNIVIPQNDIPVLNARMQGIPLAAKARRIAIYYSQMAAFQAKTEMGTDLGEILATQACAELSYEIDTEVVKLLAEGALRQGIKVKFNKVVPAGVAKAEHYEGFAEIIEEASQVIYDRTKKHAANYMVIASNVKPILSLMRGWKAANTGKINGPYFAGTLNGIKVFVSPAIKPGQFFLGFNGDDLITSAAVYAPYMAVVPTQLLGFADGAMSQGFSTLYDLKMLNEVLLVAGEVVEEDQVIVTRQLVEEKEEEEAGE